jgi:hypothetical protein
MIYEYVHGKKEQGTHRGDEIFLEDGPKQNLINSAAYWSEK